jgi:hypothetical protein
MVVLAAVLCASSARAQGEAQEGGREGTCTETPSDREVRARLRFLAGQLSREEPPVRRWYTTFMVLHGVMGGMAAILAATAQDENFRNEMLVGTTSSTLALTTLLIFSPPLMGAGDRLRALPEDTPDARLHKMRVAEGIFFNAAANLDFFWGWFPSTMSSLYVTAAASVLLLAFNRPQGAIIHSIGGAVLGLGRLLLHPSGGRHVWRRYRRAFEDAGCAQETAPPPPPPEARAQIVPYGLGVGVHVEF